MLFQDSTNRAGNQRKAGMNVAYSNTADGLIEYFLDLLFKGFSDIRHIFQVRSWLTFVIKAIYNLPGVVVVCPRVRQIKFYYQGYWFKARYGHPPRLGSRGGLEIIKILPGQGEPDGPQVFVVMSLDDAEKFYRSAKKIMDTFILNNP